MFQHNLHLSLYTQMCAAQSNLLIIQGGPHPSSLRREPPGVLRTQQPVHPSSRICPHQGAQPSFPTWVTALLPYRRLGLKVGPSLWTDGQSHFQPQRGARWLEMQLPTPGLLILLRSWDRRGCQALPADPHGNTSGPQGVPSRPDSPRAIFSCALLFLFPVWI